MGFERSQREDIMQVFRETGARKEEQSCLKEQNTFKLAEDDEGGKDKSWENVCFISLSPLQPGIQEIQ